MKQYFIPFSILIISLLAWSCDDSQNSTPTIDDSSNLSGVWKVSYYWDKDKEETSDFNGYSFKFEEDGTFIAERNGNTQKGSWKVSDSSKKFIISINSVKPLDDLVDDWLIIEKSDNLIKLRDDSDDHLEELYFKRF